MGEFQNQRFVDAIRRVAERAKVHGKAAGIQPPSVAQARQAISMGYNVISMGHETAAYANALRTMVEELRT